MFFRTMPESQCPKVEKFEAINKMKGLHVITDLKRNVVLLSLHEAEFNSKVANTMTVLNLVIKIIGQLGE